MSVDNFLGMHVGSKGLALSKKEALQVLGAPVDSTFEQAKRSFRRQAMKWHPDRNTTPGAEEKFKSIRASYELLEELSDNGHWDAPETMEENSAKAGESESPSDADTQADGGGQDASGRRPKPKPWRKSWDPSNGPLFDVGYGQEDVVDSACDFFDSFMNVADHLLGSGASPRMVATVLSRGFHGYMSDMAFELTHVPMLKVVFLKSFWARRRASFFEAMRLSGEMFAGLGWAQAIVDIIQPLTDWFEHGGLEFYIFREMSRHLPTGRPSDSDLNYYRQCVRSWPLLFNAMAKNEKGLRVALGVRGMQRGPMLIESALDVCPKLLEVWAPLGTPRTWGTRADWFGRALASNVDPVALEGWARDEDLGKFCARLTALHSQPQASRWKFLYALASERMSEQSDWRLAGPWSGAKDALLGRAQKRMDHARKKLKAGAMGSVAVGLGISSLSVGQKAVRDVVFGDANKVGEVLARAKLVGRLGEALNFEKSPVAALCAMRYFFDLDEPLNFYERAQGFESVAGVEQLARLDSDGLSAMDWFERAIARRKKLGIE
jgi:hypothetical protein